jgi:hypothetical protein
MRNHHAIPATVGHAAESFGRIARRRPRFDALTPAATGLVHPLPTAAAPAAAASAAQLHAAARTAAARGVADLVSAALRAVLRQTRAFPRPL